MKTKKFICVLFLCMSFLLSTSCQQKAPQISSDDDSVEWIALTDTVDLTGMNLFWQYDFEWHIIPNTSFADDDIAKISIYTDAYKDYNGEFMYNDSHEWMLLMETSSGVYPLFPRKTIHIGGISCAVFFDDDNALHVLITEQWGSSYQIYDCIFDCDRNAFMVKSVYDSGIINFISNS